MRWIPELNSKDVEQPGLFDLHRFHAVFTTADFQLLDAVAADKTHRQHAVIEQVNSDLKNAPWRTCRQGSSPRMPPGWYARS